MEYVRLGKSGLKVSRICLGTLTFGREADAETSFKIMDHYVALGGDFLDTADIYSAGGAEEIVGRWLKQRGIRDDIVLATKVYGITGPGPNDGGLSRIHIQHAVEASLRRLQTEVIDLYQIHRWDPHTPLEETVRALDDVVHQGKVRYLGCSNLAAWQLCKFLRIADQHNWPRFVSIQPAYNALNRAIECETLPLCEAEGLGVITYNPLAGGMLTGKYKRGQPMPSGARLEAFENYYQRYFADNALDIVEQFADVAKQRGVTPAQLALAWILSEPRITCPIVGARNLEQLGDTLGGLEIHLTPNERQAVPSIQSGHWVGKDPVYDRKY